MSQDIKYPTPERIVELNILALSLIKSKKADAAKVVHYFKIKLVIDGCTSKEGDIYDKSIILLKGLIQKHPFASGNRRTALIATKDFLRVNKAPFRVNNHPADARVLQGIRENFYTDQELKEWIKHGSIKEFRR